MQEKDSPKVLPALAIFLAALIAFFVVQFLSLLLLGILMSVLTSIPILSSALRFLFAARGDTPALLTLYVSCILSYKSARFTAERFANHTKTAALSILLTGAFITVIYGIALISNITSGGPVLTDIAQIITGLIMVFKGKAEL